MKKIIAAALFAGLAAAGAASAQTTGLVSVSNSSGSTTPNPGASDAAFGSVTLTATQPGTTGNVTVSSLPFTLTTGNGASASNLTSCEVLNSNGSTLTSGSNVIGTAGASGAFTLDSPLTISGGQSATLSVRCDVVSGASTGGTYQFTFSTPTATGAGTTSGAGLRVNLNTSPNVRPGAQDTLFGLITLSAAQSSSAIQVASIPISASFVNGAQVGHISDCRVRSLSNLVTPLNNGANAVGIVQGATTIPLDSPLVVGAGSSQTLAFTCDVSAAAPIGGGVTLSMTPSSVPATVVGSGTSVTPTVGVGSNNIPGATSGTVVFANVTSPGPSVPGIPNTGADMAQNLFLLAVASIVALGGFFLARRMMASI